MNQYDRVIQTTKIEYQKLLAKNKKLMQVANNTSNNKQIREKSKEIEKKLQIRSESKKLTRKKKH